MTSIRLLQAHDVIPYHRLRLQAVASDPHAYLSTVEVETAKPLQYFSTELMFASLKAPFGYYGLFNDDTLIGYIQLGTTGLAKQSHIAYFYNLYLDPHFRGQQLATQLCETVIAQAQAAGLERIFAVSLAANQPALNFYHSLGFQNCGRRSQSVKWHDTYDDEVELVKVLLDHVVK